MTKNGRVRRVARLCCHCARNVAYYRAWWEGKELVTKDDFFVNANSNALDIAVLDWCILFTDRRGKQHWRKVVPEPAQFMHKLYTQLGIDKNFFDEHCLKTKTYRDKFLAHLDEDRVMNIPDLTITLNSVVFLYGILRSEYSDMLTDAPRDLRQYYRERLANGKRHTTRNGLTIMNFNNEHSIETYKSLITIAQFGLRFVLLINGGAAIAVLAFVGDLASSVGMPDVGMALTWYVLGIAFGGIALATSYLTQLVLYNEARSEPSPRFLRKHQHWLTISFALVFSSIVAFVLGSFSAVASYEALFSNSPLRLSGY